MKIILYPIVFIFLFLSNTAFSQGELREAPPRDAIDKLRKEKLMEKLQIDESTANKFFELFDRNMRIMRSLNKEKRELMAALENDINLPDLERKLDRLLTLDSEMEIQRREHINELKKFLTARQIVQSIILQKNFMKELRKEIDKHKKRRF